MRGDKIFSYASLLKRSTTRQMYLVIYSGLALMVFLAMGGALVATALSHRRRADGTRYHDMFLFGESKGRDATGELDVEDWSDSIDIDVD